MADATTGMRRGPYAKSAKQRELVARAALEHFGQHGYHGTSMREIARGVGMSQAGLLHHFPTKAELLTAVLETRDALTHEAVAPAPGVVHDPLARLVAIVADNAEQRELVKMFVVVSAEATDDRHPAHDYFQRRSHAVIGLMRAGLEQAAEQGRVRADLDLDVAARQCQAMMFGLQAQWLLDPSTDMVAIFRAFLDGFGE